MKRPITVAELWRSYRQNLDDLLPEHLLRTHEMTFYAAFNVALKIISNNMGADDAGEGIRRFATLEVECEVYLQKLLERAGHDE